MQCFIHWVCEKDGRVDNVPARALFLIHGASGEPKPKIPERKTNPSTEEQEPSTKGKLLGMTVEDVVEQTEKWKGLREEMTSPEQGMRDRKPEMTGQKGVEPENQLEKAGK